MLGRFLFRWRGVIGVLAFGVVFWLARPTFGSCLLGVPLLILGLAVRFWASGYIGIEGRVREIGGRREVVGRSERLEARGESAEPLDGQRTRIVSGPYRMLRHPLYIGNLLLVLGMLSAMRPLPWLSVVVVVGFIAEYALIIVAEEKDLAGRRSQKLEARSEIAEVADGQGGSNADCRMQTAKGKMAEGESFSYRRAMCEWRTWVVTGAGWGLALVRVALSGR
jgi:hypothetical protein